MHIVLITLYDRLVVGIAGDPALEIARERQKGARIMNIRNLREKKLCRPLSHAVFRTGPQSLGGIIHPD